MEFLKAMEQAKQYGLSKDEFLPLWQLELQDKLNKKTDQEASSGQNSTETLPNNESLLQQNFDELRKILTETKLQLDTQLNCLHKEAKEEQEKHWESFQKCHKSMEENFNRCFEMLSKHVTNSVESQTSGLKMFLVRELEVIKQEIMRQLEGFSPSLMSTHPASWSVDSGVEWGDSHGTLDQHQQCKQLQPNQQKVQQEAPYEMQQPPHQQDQELSEQQQKKVIETIQPKGENKILSSDAKMLERSKQSTDSSCDSLSEPWDYSHDLISREDVSDDDGRQLSNLPGKQNLSGLDLPPTLPVHLNNLLGVPQANGTALQTVLTLPNLPLQAEFIIKDCSILRSTGYYSPFFQPASKICKVRVHLTFNSKYETQVELLVSRGENALRLEWPIIIRSHGNIYNTGSQSYTSLWNLQSIECELPQFGEELAFKALVCLKTNRHNHTDVTYQTLEEKFYIMEDEMKMNFYFEKLRK